MPFRSMKEILGEAQAGRYGVGVFCGNTIETYVAACEAAIEERSPLIIATGGFPRRAQAALVRALAEDAPVPVAMVLDHGRDFAAVMECIRVGFSDVMIDGSSLPYEENVALTRKVVEAAHAAQVGVEAEIGHVGLNSEYAQVEERGAGLTEPAEAVRFVADTGVDFLAVAVGTAHGLGQAKRVPKLDFERLNQIRNAVPTPLVLHGGSGVTDDDFRTAIANGICKINIFTALALAGADAIRQVAADPKSTYGQMNAAAKAAIKASVVHHMRVFGSSGKANASRKYWLAAGVWGMKASED